ncbi:CYCP4_1 [Arabidopsis lyrata subsp. lyrata]|uniref:Cyclin n=1 Tax=Arabidopsis lyrata subsp. lyrata TaxID=81972 RepID=D7LBR4_ARALL|nr:cyclin-U4-1 [Arabidopsis lyrata subsp. lyrata]EFH58237.1 CYCP4_1 [Arabidopsis lyrata subsp. lyrata]|eukprot:XP_020882772.1 cyclin-U4-1 [Arabidopsis lyrata subsp. lyrata]
MAELENPSVMSKLIAFLSSLLERVAESNDLTRRVTTQSQRVSVFHGLSRPTITIQSYLQRIFKYANCSPSCFVVAYVYLDRFTHRQPSLPINSFNVHRLLITSVMVAAKFLDDLYYNNAYYAKVGGISTKEMNFLELDFLFGLGFELNVTPNTFNAYFSYLQKEMTLLQPLSLVVVPSSRSVVTFNDDEASHQKQQQQLAV